MTSLYESIVEESNDGIFVAHDGEIVYVNQRLQELTGYARSELLGAAKTELVAPGDELLVEAHHRARTAGYSAPGQYEVEFETRAGDRVPIELSVSQIEYEGNTAAVAFCRDISEQTEHKRELERAQQRLNVLFEEAPDAIVIHDSDGNLLDVNRQLVDDLGYTRSELLSMAVTDYEVGLDAAEIHEHWAGMDVGETLKVEGEHRRKDGSTFPVEVWVSKIEIHGELRFLALSRDVTDRKEREEELLRTRRLIEKTQENASIGWWEIDLVEETLTWSDEVYRIHEHPTDTAIELEEAIEFYHPDDRGTIEAALDRLTTNGEGYDLELRIVTAKDRVRWIRTVGDPWYDDEGELTGVLGIFQDITQRKEYEGALEADQEKLRQIIDLVPDLIFVKNHGGEYLLANEATAEAYGSTPEEVEGKREADIIPNVENSEEFREDDLEVIESGEPKEVSEEELTTADGDTRILQTTKIPYQVPGSGEDAVLGYARDVTDLKKYEHRLQTQRDNLEILNQVVRHDIRNDLQLVLAYAETLKTHVDEDGDEYVNQVLEAARDAVDITATARDVTDVMLQSDVDRHPVQLRSVLENVVESVRSSQIRAVITIDGTIPNVDVFADDMLESVFRNLLTNAIKHNDKEIPEVTVSTTLEHDAVSVRITDNGPGIPDERKEEVFEQGEMDLDSGGTGLGLYLVDTLVDRYGGDVHVEDNDPEGSIFVVELPLEAGSAA